MKRTKKIPILTALLIACTLGAVFAWTTLDADRRTAALRAKGYPTNLTELNEWYEQPPTGENAADYYLEAGLQIGASDFPELDQIAVLGSRSDSGMLGMLGKDVSPTEMQRTAAFLKYHAEAYDLMAQAAQFDGARYPVNFTLGPAMSFDHFGTIRDAWRALLLKTYFHCAQGSAPDAVATFEQLTHAVNSLDDEPLLLAALTRIPLSDGAVRSSEYLLNTVTPAPAELARLNQALSSLADNQQVLRVVIGERLYDEGLFRNATGVAAGFAPLMEYGHLRTYDNFIELIEKPIHEVVDELKDSWENSDLSFGLHDIPALDKWTAQLPMKRIGPLARVALHYADNAALVAAARAAVGVEIARAAGSPIPEQPGDLPPEYRANWPIDPFTNEPIRYRKLSNGYVTYSVGPDLQDDHGLDETAKFSSHNDRGNPDIAFRILR